MNATHTRISVVVVSLGLVVAAATAGYAADEPLENVNTWYYAYGNNVDDWYDYEGTWYARAGASFYPVSDDEGRFREDRFLGDDFTGGLEQLSYSSEELQATIRAVFEDEYVGDGHYVRPDQFRLDVEVERFRKHFDGSNEAWIPQLYGLPDWAADRGDENLYIDRVNVNVEGTLLLPDLPNVTFGWLHRERFGSDVLLRGGGARNDFVAAPLENSIETIPTIRRVDGTSNTLYLEIPFTYHERYNYIVQTEYEWYSDDQVSIQPFYRVLGAGQPATFQEDHTQSDDLDWHEWRSRFGFDSFLTDNIFFSASYRHHDLQNSSDREVTRPGPAPSGGRAFQFINTDVEADRDLDILNAGVAFLNVVENLNVYANYRFDQSTQDARHYGLEDGFGGPAVPTFISNASQQDETRMGESVRVVWQGTRNTTATFSGEWEQRWLDIQEAEGGVLSRDVDLEHDNQKYTFTVVNRPRRDVKLMARYRYTQNETEYEPVFDFDPGGYPDILGDMEQKVHEVTLKGDWQFLPLWTASAKYQYENDVRKYDIQTTYGQDLDVHRISGTVYGIPVDNLVVSAMAMYESYELGTPVNAPVNAANWAPGTGAYDYEYDAFIVFTSGTLALNDRWDLNLAYQHTELNGNDVDNGLDEVWAGAEFQLAENKTVEVRYEFFNFDDELGDGFDDYHGHGIYLAFACTF